MKIFATPYRAAKAVGAGVVDYGKKHKAANMQAEKNLAGTFGNSSQAADVQRVAKETRRIKKEQGISLRNSIRSKLELEF